MKNWSLSIVGLRSAVVSKISAAKEIPAEAKALLASLVAGLPEAFNGAAVDAHCVAFAGGAHLHLTVGPKQLAE